MSGHIYSHHILPLKVYVGVAGALFVLTVVTVVAAWFDFGSFNLFIALLIATVKSTLVALYFMHLKYDNKLYLTLLVMSLVFLAIFIGITMLDTLFRGEIDAAREGPINKEAIIYKK
jgi:cytochrome c oxidase subunit 4